MHDTLHVMRGWWTAGCSGPLGQQQGAGRGFNILLQEKQQACHPFARPWQACAATPLVCLDSPPRDGGGAETFGPYIGRGGGPEGLLLRQKPRGPCC
jgi:hypothetical protein